MAKGYKFNKRASLEEGEVILDKISPAGENQESNETFKEPTNVEVAISAPTKADLQLASKLSGTPCTFDSEYQSVLESLARYGIAASFGADGFARGHKWHQFCK